VGEAIGDPTVPMRLVSGIGEVDSAEPSYALWELSRQVNASSEIADAFDRGVADVLDRLAAADSDEAKSFLAAWDHFIVAFGSRGPNEWEIHAETWETDPTIALAALDRIRLQADDESPSIRNRARADEREATVAEVRAKLAEIGNDELTGQFEGALVAGNQMAFRERTKTNIVRSVHEGRMAFHELGQRHAEADNLVDPKHIFMLLDAELEDFVADPGAFTETLAKRAEDWHQIQELEPPFFIRDGHVPPLSEWERKGAVEVPKARSGDVLQGVPGCPGTVTGTARVILDPSDPGALEPGDIMVAPLTDPAWTPLFMAAGGVVVNVGGQISHAIIVSRELGLPCVISCEGATDRIPDGAQIEVDGNTGTVRVI